MKAQYGLLMVFAFFAVAIATASSGDRPVVHRDYPVAQQGSSSDDEEILKWKTLLDQLLTESRSLSKDSLPPVLADIAIAYCLFDRETAAATFSAAFDEALALDPNSRESGPAITAVISRAAGCDSALPRRFAEKLTDQRLRGDWTGFFSAGSAAIGLLQQDPEVAADVALTGSAGGISLDTAFFIMRLAQTNPEAADRVLSAYLRALISQSDPQLDQVLWLAGFVLGYGEGWPGPGAAGFGGLRVEGLRPNPILAPALLTLALRSAQATAERAAKLDPADAEPQLARVLFAAEYLGPEVAKYQLADIPAWSALRQQAVAGTSPAVKQTVSALLDQVNDLRTRASTTTAESFRIQQAEEMAAEAEKLPEGCRRDGVYARAAIALGSLDSAKSIALIARIKDPGLRRNIEQFRSYDFVIDALKVKDIEAAQQHAERLNSREQRALVYISMAREVQKDGDTARARELLGETRRIAESVSAASEQASILLAASLCYAAFDSLEAFQVLQVAVNAVNQSGKPNVETFSVERRVNMACSGEPDQWFGGTVGARASLFESLSAVAFDDPVGALSLARHIEDAALRIRAQAAIAYRLLKEADSPTR